jgi:hypothetical protein
VKGGETWGELGLQAQKYYLKADYHTKYEEILFILIITPHLTKYYLWADHHTTYEEISLIG